MSTAAEQIPANSLQPHSRQLGALDLGSNSFHLLIAQESNGQLRVLDKHKEMVRLAAGLDDNNQLTPQAIERALECLERFAQRLRTLDAEHVRVVGTNTLRRVQDSTGFLSKAESILGHKIDVISGREEARLIYIGVCNDLGVDDNKRLVVDIGGGSTELILGHKFQPEDLESLYMGCVSMSLRHFASGKISKQAMQRAIEDARVELEPVVHRFMRSEWHTAIGTSGTINAVRDAISTLFDSEKVTGAHLEDLRHYLIDAGTLEKLDINGLSEERKAVFPGGVAILSAVFDALDAKTMTAAQSALREGVIYDLMGRHQDDDARDRTAADLMQRFSIDQHQARQVRDTSLSFLSQLARAWQLTTSQHKLALSWAANLHELGIAVSHSGYHKHGGYLLANMDMPGFSQTDQQQLAILVRTHRRRISRGSFGNLSEAYVKLAVILRLSAVFHRNRSHASPPHIEAVAEDNKLILSLPKKWLKSHPLTALDLANEARYLKDIDIDLAITKH